MEKLRMKCNARSFEFWSLVTTLEAACVRNLDLRISIALKASKSAGAKGDVPKINGFVHTLHPCWCIPCPLHKLSRNFSYDDKDLCKEPEQGWKAFQSPRLLENMTRWSKSYHRAVAHNELIWEPGKLQTDYGKVTSCWETLPNFYRLFMFKRKSMFIDCDFMGENFIT